MKGGEKYMSTRLSWDFYYLGIAESTSKRSTCLNKHYGAVIVKDNRIISTGYNGAPRNCVNCCDTEVCLRLANGIKRGTNYADACLSVHAEQNAIISASRGDMLHSTLYLYGYDVNNDHIVNHPDSCSLCKRMIINAGIDTVVIADEEIGIPSDDTDIPYKAHIINVEDWNNPKVLNPLMGY